MPGGVGGDPSVRLAAPIPIAARYAGVAACDDGADARVRQIIEVRSHRVFDQAEPAAVIRHEHIRHGHVGRRIAARQQAVGQQYNDGSSTLVEPNLRRDVQS